MKIKNKGEDAFVALDWLNLDKVPPKNPTIKEVSVGMVLGLLNSHVLT